MRCSIIDTILAMRSSSELDEGSILEESTDSETVFVLAYTYSKYSTLPALAYWMFEF
jgi:hypothetical protein